MSDKNPSHHHWHSIIGTWSHRWRLHCQTGLRREAIIRADSGDLGPVGPLGTTPGSFLGLVTTHRPGTTSTLGCILTIYSYLIRIIQTVPTLHETSFVQLNSTTGCPTIEFSLCFACYLGFPCSYRGSFYHFQQPRRRRFQNSPYFPPYVKN